MNTIVRDTMELLTEHALRGTGFKTFELARRVLHNDVMEAVTMMVDRAAVDWLIPTRETPVADLAVPVLQALPWLRARARYEFELVEALQMPTLHGERVDRIKPGPIPWGKAWSPERELWIDILRRGREAARFQCIVDATFLADDYPEPLGMLLFALYAVAVEPHAYLARASFWWVADHGAK